jgi:DNA polymerase/3'-5' exonuclease PolX
VPRSLTRTTARTAPSFAPVAGTIVRMAVETHAEGPLPTNGDLARVFHEIGDLLEIKGELVFKTVAYHRAADAIAHSPVEIARAYRAGTPPRIPGVGKAISDKIAELATTGHLAFLDRLHAEVPATLTEVLAIPGLGPKTVKLLWERLGITSLDDLRAALESGALRDAKRDRREGRGGDPRGARRAGAARNADDAGRR